MLDQVDEDWPQFPQGEDRFRSSERFRWLYQTDGWEGYQDDEVEEILTRPRESKPWHVPDEKIKAMVEEAGQKEGIPQSLLQHAKCRRPRLLRPNGNGVHGSAAETDEEWQALLQELDEAGESSRASQRPSQASILAPEVSTLPRRPSVMQRSVRFEEQKDDALDRMLKHEEELVQNGQGYEEPRRKKWMITDEEFREFVLSMAKSNADPKVDTVPSSGLTSSASAPLLKGSVKEMMLHIYFVDSQDVMSIRVSPDLRIGPPRAPKGNRFTDIYGLGANTKGFAEFKKFDYQRRTWLGGFQKDWVPAWSVSLKGMIAELTGMDVARQRLFCKGMAMGNDNLTLQSWNVTDGDTLQVRFQHKISQEQMEAVHKACQNAGHVERSVASINDPSLPVRAEMESSTSSDFWKPWMGRMKPAEKSQRSRSTRTPRDAKPVMLKDDSHTAQLRHSKHIRRCTSKSDVWMMPRWVSTSVVVLAAEMLRNAQTLVEQKMHPQVIIRGYRFALAAARAQLEALAMDNGKDPAKFREDLLRIARTTLSSKLLQHEKDHFATLAVDAVLRLGGKPNLDYIQVLKKAGGSLKDSFLEEGFILEKRIGVGHKKALEDCKVLVANCQMDTDKIKIYGARVKVDSLEAVAEIEQAEKDKMKKKIEKIVDHKCNVFINRQLIYNYPDQLLKEAGVMAIEHSDFDGSERLAAVLGADIASTFENPEMTVLGSCKRIEEIMIGEDKVIKFSGCSKGEACTIVLRGSSQHVLDEAERSLHDALAVLYQTVQETRVVWGGGSMEMAMAQAVQQKLTGVGGKESVAMESFGKALMQIPVILADNAGLDSAELVGQLRAAHAKGQNSFGLEFNNGTIADMSQLGIMESFRSKMSQLCSAAEAAEMIIRVDDIIKNAPRQRDG